MNLNQAIAYFKPTWNSEIAPDVELSNDDMPIDKPYCDGLSVFYLIDEGDQFSLVQNKHIQKAGITLEKLNQYGIENLSKIADEIKMTENEGLIYFSGSGNFEASLLLVEKIWNEWLVEYCPNGYIAAIPARDILVVCDRKDKRGITKLFEIVERIWPIGDHLLSNSLYCYKRGRWVKLANA